MCIKNQIHVHMYVYVWLYIVYYKLSVLSKARIFFERWHEYLIQILFLRHIVIKRRKVWLLISDICRLTFNGNLKGVRKEGGSEKHSHTIAHNHTQIVGERNKVRGLFMGAELFRTRTWILYIIYFLDFSERKKLWQIEWIITGPRKNMYFFLFNWMHSFILPDTGCSLNIVFFPNLSKYSELCFPSVSVCVHKAGR